MRKMEGGEEGLCPRSIDVQIYKLSPIQTALKNVIMCRRHGMKMNMTTMSSRTNRCQHQRHQQLSYMIGLRRRRCVITVQQLSIYTSDSFSLLLPVFYHG